MSVPVDLYPQSSAKQATIGQCCYALNRKLSHEVDPPDLMVVTMGLILQNHSHEVVGNLRE